MANESTNFAQLLATGNFRMIDLTHTLSPKFPQLVLPPQFGQASAFKIEEISHYDERGVTWYWNNFTCCEHTGTHFDAPIHWSSGKDLPHNSVDTIDPHKFIASAVVVDATEPVSHNEDWLLTPDYLKQWEAKHGRIPNDNWVLFRTGWGKRLESNPSSYANVKADGAHTPGPTQEAVEWLIKERNVHGFGVETINTDAGQAFGWPLPYPCHTLMHGNGRFGLQCLNNLDKLPPTGSVIIAAPLKIEHGSGSPLRVLALVP